jgi:hypothetical protein
MPGAPAAGDPPPAAELGALDAPNGAIARPCASNRAACSAPRSPRKKSGATNTTPGAAFARAAIRIEGDAAESMLKLVDALEDLDDVQEVYANYDISDEEMARFAS